MIMYRIFWMDLRMLKARLHELPQNVIHLIKDCLGVQDCSLTLTKKLYEDEIDYLFMKVNLERYFKSDTKVEVVLHKRLFSQLLVSKDSDFLIKLQKIAKILLTSENALISADLLNRVKFIEIGIRFKLKKAITNEDVRYIQGVSDFDLYDVDTVLINGLFFPEVLKRSNKIINDIVIDTFFINRENEKYDLSFMKHIFAVNITPDLLMNILQFLKNKEEKVTFKALDFLAMVAGRRPDLIKFIVPEIASIIKEGTQRELISMIASHWRFEKNTVYTKRVEIFNVIPRRREYISLSKLEKYIGKDHFSTRKVEDIVSLIKQILLVEHEHEHDMRSKFYYFLVFVGFGKPSAFNREIVEMLATYFFNELDSN